MADSDVTERKGARRRRPARATIAQVEALGTEGQQFGRFFVIERLGEGGMGVVIAAYDPQLDRKVAIKVLRPDGLLARTELREQMIREAQAMAKLSHPNVVQVHEVGTVERAFFIVMELVEGQTLKQWAATPRTWREIVATLVDAGRGLEAAHASGLVHRDFKPHNILVGDDGRVRVTDFGVVGVAGTSDNIAAGTPAYMAPEQHTPAVVDARADQFAFCATLFELLYGQPPFDGDTPDELALAVWAGAPPQPTGSKVPARVHAVIARGLSAEPAMRYASMTELLAALTRDPARRWRTAAIGALVAGLAGIAVLGWSRGVTPKVRATNPCHTDATLATTWNPAIRGKLTEAFRALVPELGGETAALVAPRLDAYATAWTTERRQACTRHVSQPVREAALACLDRRRDQFAALAGMLATASDRAIVERAVAAAASLEPLRECASIGVSTRPHSAAFAPMGAQLDRARALRAVGQAREAVTLARQVLAGATEPQLEANAALILGGALGDLEDADGARKTLLRALRVASTAGDDQLVAHAYTELAWVTTYIAGRPEDALAMAPFMEAAVARAGSPATLRAFTEFVQGSALTELARYREARTHLDTAWELWRNQLDPAHPDATRVLLTIANIHGYEGDLEAARRLTREVIRLREASLGAHHPALAGPLSNLGSDLADDGNAAEAITLCTRSLALAPTPSLRSSALRCRGRALARLGDLDAAERDLTAALELVTGGPNARAAYVLAELGEVAIDRGELDRALELCTRALDTFSDGTPEHPDRSFALACLGRARLAKRDLTGARVDLESALAVIADEPRRARITQLLTLL